MQLPTLNADQRRRGSMFLLGIGKDDAYLGRSQVTAKLRAAGFPVGETTLARLAAERKGPPLYRFGKIPLYRWEEVLEWAQEGLVRPVLDHSVTERKRTHLAGERATRRIARSSSRSHDRVFRQRPDGNPNV
jgi:hypothetical protein